MLTSVCFPFYLEEASQNATCPLPAKIDRKKDEKTE